MCTLWSAQPIKYGCSYTALVLWRLQCSQGCIGSCYELFEKYINFTNVVKCSTYCNFGVLFPEFKGFLAQKCIENHFVRELRILQPKIIILYIDQKSMEEVIIPILGPCLKSIGLDDPRIIKLYRPSSVKDVQIEDISKAKTQYINILDRLKPLP